MTTLESSIKDVCGNAFHLCRHVSGRSSGSTSCIHSSEPRKHTEYDKSITTRTSDVKISAKKLVKKFKRPNGANDTCVIHSHNSKRELEPPSDVGKGTIR